MLDDQVRRAMRKWPQVPAVHGWLRLSRRGQWLLVDRSQPGFSEARDGAGSPITSPPIVDFIGRNYECDDSGAWYWQNGPQRAFVRLELAPLILRVLNEPPQQRLVTHTGFIVAHLTRVLGDADGNLLMQTDLGPAALDDRDLGQLQFSAGDDGALAVLLEQYPACPPQTAWRIEVLPVSGAAALGRAMGFVADPLTTATMPAAAPAPPEA